MADLFTFWRSDLASARDNRMIDWKESRKEAEKRGKIQEAVGGKWIANRELMQTPAIAAVEQPGST